MPDVKAKTLLPPCERYLNGWNVVTCIEVSFLAEANSIGSLPSSGLKAGPDGSSKLAEGVACPQGDFGIFSSPEDCEHGPDVD